MRIAFLLTRRVPDVPSPIVQETVRLLAEEGHEVAGWIPEDRLLRSDELADEADLYVLKSHTEHALSYAAALHAQGTAVFNPLPACLLAQDKATAVRRMRELGVPTPPSWLIARPEQAAPLLADGPIVVKPHRGHRGAGVHLASTVEELAGIPPSPVPLIAQRHVPGPGEDLKVYVAGERVWAVRKPFDERSFTRPGRPVEVDERIRRIAADIRAGFGLELFGFDAIESPAGPVVVDLNYFPGYKGCPDPAPGIAAAISRFARSR